MTNSEHRVYAAALLAQVDTYDKAEGYTLNKDAMAIHSVAVDGYCGPEISAKLLQTSTGITACRETHYALNRCDYYTCKAMVADMQRCPDSAAMFRKRAEAWYAYFNDAARQERANFEDEARCAALEAREAAALEEWYR